MKLIKSVRASWQTLVVVLSPILLCPLVFPYSETSQESKCASLIILMAIFWITEALPTPVTSLMPIVICPLLGIASSKQVCKAFFGDITFLLLGGIIVAIAIEECNLHKRLALKILIMIGVEPRRLMLGIMLTTGFLSMWISNTATTAMMMPITRSLLAKLFKAKEVTKRQLVSDRESINGDQDIGSADYPSPSDDKLITYPVETITIEYASRPAPKIARLESVELKKLNETTSTGWGRSDEENNVPDEQSHQQEGDRYPPAHQDVSFRQQGHTEALDNEADHHSESPAMDTAEDDDKDEDTRILSNLDPKNRSMLKAFYLCVCYSANVGGMATLTGTAPNMVLSRMIADMSKTSLVTFANWMALSLPISVLTLIGCFIWMNFNVFGIWNTLTCKSISTDEEVKYAAKTIKQEYDKLGKIRFNEVIVLVHFILLVALWLTRDPGSFEGWAFFFKRRYVSDGSTALALAISLFIFPNKRPNVLFFRRKGDTSAPQSSPSIMTWRQTSRKFPWGVMLLLAGGFSLSEASKVSGLSKEIANRLMVINSLPVWAAGLVVTIMTSLVTELTSNTVVVMLILPILNDISGVLSVHPMYLMLPATLAASLAFMLPVATPPNALVFAYGDLRVIDMVKFGAVLNLIGIVSIFLAVNTWGIAIYNLNVLPDWARLTGISGGGTNFTMTSPTLSNFTVASSYLSNFTNKM